MTDQFLKDHYRAPRPAFAAALGRRLQAIQPPAAQPAPARRALLPRAAFAALALLLALGLALTVSPGVRAQVLALYQQVGGLIFQVTGDYPGGSQPPTIIPAQALTLDEARQTFPAAFSLPAWLPDGYQMNPELSLTDFSENGNHFVSLLVTYQDEARGTAFFLNINHSPAGEEYSQIIGPGSVEEVSINGRPAGLVRGIWNSQTRQWDDDQHLSLFWQAGGAAYDLSAHEFALSKEDLLRIAESIP